MQVTVWKRKDLGTVAGGPGCKHTAEVDRGGKLQEGPKWNQCIIIIRGRSSSSLGMARSGHMIMTDMDQMHTVVGTTTPIVIHTRGRAHTVSAMMM